MEINFDKLQDEILDIKDERREQNRIITLKICQFLNTRKNKFFAFDEINEARERNLSPTISYFNSNDGMKWMERDELKVDYIEYNTDERDFLAVGHIEGEEDCFSMLGRNMDLDSLYNIVDWLAAYQREQNGTAKTPEQVEREMNEERFGKEYYTNEKYRLFIQTQLEPEERLMLALYNMETEEEKRKRLPMTKRTQFALIIREV